MLTQYCQVNNKKNSTSMIFAYKTRSKRSIDAVHGTCMMDLTKN